MSADIAFNANPDAPVFAPLEIPNIIITDISQQGDEIVGGVWGGAGGNYYGWTTDIDKVEICHNHRIIKVAFRHSMEDHPTRGDPFGACVDRGWS